VRGKLTNKIFEEAMDAIESGTTSLRKTSRHWNIPLPIFGHLNGKTQSRKCGLVNVLTKKED